MFDSEGLIDRRAVGVVERLVIGEQLRERFKHGKRFISPISYYWADWYKGAGSKWRGVFGLGDALGFMVVNVDSGSGPRRDEDWVTQARLAREAGVTVLGYVRTTYGRRPVSEIVREVRNHAAWYEVDGVFLDEAVNGFGDQWSMIGFYRDLYQAIKGEFGGRFIVVANPGTVTVESMLECADVLMTFEQSAEKYLASGDSVFPEYYYKYPSTRFWHVVHDVTRGNARDVLLKAGRGHVGHLYLTDLSFVASEDPQSPTVNPYEAPASPWLHSEQLIWAHCGVDAYERMTAS